MIDYALAVLAISLAVLVLSGKFTVRLLNRIATAFGLSEFSVAFLFLAVATSIPELFIAITSASKGAGDIVLAVALGSNIVNMTLIIGLAAILSAGIATSGLNLRRDIFIGMAITMLPILMLYDGILSRIDGIVLLLAFGFYITLLFRDKQRFNQTKTPRNILSGIVSIFGLGTLIAILVVASNTTVSSSVTVATAIGVPTFVIGLFILALGTSLPELTTTLSSALQKKPGMALGNILGSNVADSALVIGTASVIKPLHVTLNGLYVITALFVFISLCTLGYFSTTRQRISTGEGLILLCMFFVFGILILFSSIMTGDASLIGSPDTVFLPPTN